MALAMYSKQRMYFVPLPFQVKGIERFLGALESQTQELMETSSGQAKYEHQHRAIVWRIPRLPKHGQGSYTNHEFICRLQLTSFDQVTML